MGKKYVFGIDLGTTYTSVCYVDESGRTVVIPNLEGSDITPSVVQILDNGDAVVGDVAKENAVIEPDSTISLVKRLMGNTAVARTINGHDYSPQEISALILKKIAADVKASSLGAEMTDVVITCPAYFGDKERIATQDAGRIAGLNVMELLKEPLAAAIHFGCTGTGENKTYMVFDLGGGTFDVTIMRIDGNRIKEVCSDGDHQLGGADWDKRLIGYLKDRFTEQATGSVEWTPEDMQTLTMAAEKAKKALSAKPETAVRVEAGGESQRITVTREIFDEITEAERSSAFDITDRAIASAKAKGVTVDEILMVGGSTLMPQIKEAIIAKYGIEPKSHEPTLAVSKGAALYAVKVYQERQEAVKAMNNWTGDPAEAPAPVENPDDYAEPLSVDPLLIASGKAPEIITATTKSYGVAVVDPRNPSHECISNLIMKNTSMVDPATGKPADSVTKHGPFGTAEANQMAVSIRIYESDNESPMYDIDEDFLLGNADLKLDGNLPIGAPLEITLTLDRAGLLHVHGKDMTGGHEIDADLHIKGVMSTADVDALAEKTKSTQIKGI